MFEDGGSSLYLGSEQITLNDSAGTATGVRYYPIPGATVVRTGTGTNYGFELAADQHGTNTLYLDNTAQTPTWRQFDPYGNPRGTTTNWADNRTFLNKTTDTTTGLTDIGAREYDPTLGRFISLDPLFEATSPQELGGYTYAGSNPVTESDPTGLESCGPVHFCSGSNGTYGDYHPENDPGSKNYKGSSHYCDTHSCDSMPHGHGTAHSSSGSGCYFVLTDPCGTAHHSSSRNADYGRWYDGLDFVGSYGILTYNPFSSANTGNLLCGNNTGVIELTCTGGGALVGTVGTLQGGVAAIGAQSSKAGRLLSQGNTALIRSRASSTLNVLRSNAGTRGLAALGRSPAWSAAGRGMVVGGGVMAGWSGYLTAEDDGYSTKQAVGVGVSEGVADAAIGWGAAEAGASWGAAIGTFIEPGGGTLVGAAVGGVVGAGVAIFTSSYVNNGILKAFG